MLEKRTETQKVNGSQTLGLEGQPTTQKRSDHLSPAGRRQGEGLERLLRGHFEISAACQVDKGESEHREQ